MAEIFSFKLTDDFVSSYKYKQVPWGYRDAAGNSVGEITFIRTYSRLKQDGSKERWYEVCNRVINGIYSIQKNWAKQHRLPWNDNKAQASAKEAFDRMFNLKWTPPGRGLWLMGTEVVMERNLGAGLQNCFAGNTKIITKNGPRTLSSLSGEEIDVWTGDSWQKAVVNNFGVQKLQRVSFKPFADRSNVVYDVDVTPDHRWILDSGLHTTNIEVGDVVKSMPVRDIESIDEFNAGVRHGVIFGDGCMGTYVAKDGMMSFSARLCGKNATEMYKYFEKFTSPPSDNGDQIAHIKSYENLKDYPLPGKTADYIGGFVRGWLLADSSTTPSGSYRLASQKSDSYKWLLDNAATAGFVVSGHSLDHRDTNFGPRTSTMHITVLTPMFKKFKVVSIIELDEDIVYCPVVPIYSRFVLANGLVTGNCGFVSTFDMTRKDPGEPFAWAMDALMCGIGVGFDVRGAEKDFIVQDPTNGVITYTIPDSREGWAESIRLLVNSYLVAGESSVRFDYSLIRPYGEPIKGFGGTASGPEPLRRIHNQIASIFIARKGEKVDSRLICDIMNLIGTCVVAGNVRRSAELALGTVEDKAFMNLKNQEIFPERNSYDPENPGWGWMSNNSVSVKVGDDYNELFDLIRSNGEPGLVWLDTTRNYGRMVDGPDGKDWRVAGYNPCAEQPLESKELCTLVEVHMNNHDSIEDFQRTLKFAYLYGKTITLVNTHWPETNAVMQRNRRIGTSLTGVAQFADANGLPVLKEWMKTGYDTIKSYDRTYSEWLCVRESIRTTTVKPSGTVSILSGHSPGVHWTPGGKFFMRAIRFGMDDPLVGQFRLAGYKVEDDVVSANTVVVYFPIESNHLRSEKEVSIFEKLNLAAFAQRYWSDNGVSCTVSFNKDTEGDLLPNAVYMFDGQLKAVSFLPMGNETYPQMPYTQATAEEYREYGKTLGLVDLSVVYDAGVAAVGEKFCSNDTCTI